MNFNFFYYFLTYGSVNSQRSNPTPSLPGPLVGHLSAWSVPAVGHVSEKTLSGGGHFSILLEAVNVIPFSIFLLRYAYLDSFRYFYAL